MRIILFSLNVAAISAKFSPRNLVVGGTLISCDPAPGECADGVDTTTCKIVEVDDSGQTTTRGIFECNCIGCSEGEIGGGIQCDNVSGLSVSEPTIKGCTVTAGDCTSASGCSVTCAKCDSTYFKCGRCEGGEVTCAIVQSDGTSAGSIVSKETCTCTDPITCADPEVFKGILTIACTLDTTGVDGVPDNCVSDGTGTKCEGDGECVEPPCEDTCAPDVVGVCCDGSKECRIGKCLDICVETCESGGTTCCDPTKPNCVDESCVAPCTKNCGTDGHECCDSTKKCEAEKIKGQWVYECKDSNCLNDLDTCIANRDCCSNKCDNKIKTCL